MTSLIVFDDGLGRLGPMTDLRAAFEVRTGMRTTVGRISAGCSEPLAALWVPRRLEAIVRARAETPVNEVPDDQAFICINGRWGSPDHDLKLKPGEGLIEAETGHVIAAHLARDDAASLLRGGELPRTVSMKTSDQRVLYRDPWDVLRRLPEVLRDDIDRFRIPTAPPQLDATQVGTHAVEVHATAKISPAVILDTELGPIVIHRDAVVRPGAVICGPCSIGRGATVVENAVIRPNTVIGPRCKVGGEIGATIFQSLSNKAHDGYLGDSYVGQWVNLGAGTTNSNLLNTYGEISMRVDPDGPRSRTGRTFLGTLFGDHVKTAILTRLMTGSCLGTGAMIACTAAPPTTVRRFAWITDAGESTYRFDKFMDAAQRMMARRERTPSDAYIASLRALHPAGDDTPAQAE